MFANTLLLAASLLASTVSASPCKPRVEHTLPASDLPAPVAGTTLRAIAVGHGIQNYTCASSTASPVAAGALAVLYDVTSLYPGTPRTGLSADAWAALPSTLLWGSSVPLNLLDPAAAAPGTPEAPNADLPPSAYGAMTSDPWVPAADLPATTDIPALPFLGHHYFDAAGSPTFDLTAKSLVFSSKLKLAVDAPATSDKGVLATGAVKWLSLEDNGRNAGNVGAGALVYRVITAGGVGQSCAKEGAAPVNSVPYTTFYWFYA